MKGAIRGVPVLALALILLPTLFLRAQTVYQKEIAIMKRTAEAFDRCSALIEKAASAEEMASALSTTADELQALFPEMTSVSQSHPNWGSNPPAEVQPTMKLFDSSVNRLFQAALPKAMAFVNRHPDDRLLSEAFSRVNAILYSQ